ncbi:MAG: hypothetical protein GY725_02575 [bacterium]|nr:hypothetical protein [bacterium]
MKLRHLAIERLPGIDRPFELTKLGDGLSVIVGPNGIGKSQLCAAVRALVWHERGVKDGGLAASAVFEHQNASWRVVRDGSLHRWQRDGIDEDPPALPGERLEGCFFLGLRDLLDASDRAGLNLPNEIRRQMAGGFDLDAVQQRFGGSLPPRVGGKESKALSAAETELRNAELGQAGLEKRERELENLEKRANAAEIALQRLVHYETALSLETMRADIAQKERDLEGLPKSLADLDGREVERLEKFEEDLAQKRHDREEAEGSLRESREAASLTLLKEPIERSVLGTWRERAENLAEIERNLEVAKSEAASSQSAAEARRRAHGAHAESGTGAEPGTALAIADDFDLFAFLEESHPLAAKREELEQRLALLTERGFSDEDRRRAEVLKRGIEPLRAWLRAPDPDQRSSALLLWPGRGFWIATAIVLFALALAGFYFERTPLLTPALMGGAFGLAVAALLTRARLETRDATDWRSVARQQFPDALEPPERWSVELVQDRLRQYEDQSAKLDADEKRARDRSVERGTVEQDLKGLEAPAAALEERRIALFDRLGLAEIRPDVELVGLARALDESRAAQVEALRAQAKVERYVRLRCELLEEIAVFVSEFGEPSPTDSASARAAVHSLEERDLALRSANSNAIRDEKTRERLDRDIAQLDAGRVEIFRIAGLDAGDRVGLVRLLADLDSYLQLKTQRSELASRIERAESDLAAAEETALAACGAAQLTEEQADLKAESAQRGALDRQIGEIHQAAQAAREGHALEDALAKKSAVLDELRDRRAEALAAHAADFLIEGVRHEHETKQMPRVLERARDRFASFTHHRYELNVSPSDGGSFVAVDTTNGVGLRPEQLSDGTRAQLILAARLAFAEEAEQGADLPLFLDEALDHSDPERFHAIARSLARMVLDEARQVFYLSNDPSDVQRLRAAFAEEGCDQLDTYDLGQIRAQAARGHGAPVLRVAPLASVPSPDGTDPESYGAALGVASLDPRRDPMSQHLFYVLRDDITLLYDLLQARIETVGQCRNLLKGESPLARQFIASSEVGPQLTARIELLEIFCHAWREGRGARVERAELEQSSALSEKFLNPVVEVVAELAGNASDLLVALRERNKDPRLSGFRSKSADDLEQFFIEHGHIDDRPILDEGQINERAVGTPAANALSPRVAAELVHQWWSLSEPVG